MALIELDKISKTYYIGSELPVYALQNISLKIEAGEFIAIMGPSGSGKSTLLAILGLLDKADSGEFKLLGRNITKLSDNEHARLRNRFYGFIFQMFNLLPRINVKDNANLPFIYAEKVEEEDYRRQKAILNKIGLSDRLNHCPNQLSGGQQQRVAVARALANKPLVILADEPTGNLDTKSTNEIMDILKGLNAEGNTIIMVTHEPNLAEYANRVLLLKDGKIVNDEKKRPSIVPEINESIFQKLGKRKILTPASLKNYIFEGAVTLLGNKLRSFLSILGVLIGVAAIIAMLAVGTGAKKQVEKSLASLGTNLLQVRTSSSQRGISLGSEGATRFSFEDLVGIKKIDGVKAVIPYVNGRVQAVYGRNNWNTQVMGTSPDFQSVRDSVPTVGRFFTQVEITSRAKVAVIGLTVAQQLFGSDNPIGKQIRMNRINFTVIGVLPEKGATGFRNQDDQILVPVTTAMYRLIGTQYINYFDVQATDTDALLPLQEEIPPVLVKLHRMPQSQADGFDVRNMADIQKALSETANTFSYLLGSIAAVSLLVGGIGIMNIMLVMVMERTREIGLRKALGAENLDIVIQFLVEAVLICLAGGMFGILLGAIITWLIATFAGWMIFISTSSILLAFTFSILTGLIFGLWPAWRAAKLLPIVALRYE